MPRRSGEKKFDVFRFDIDGETIEVPVWRVDSGGAYESSRTTTFRAAHEPSHTNFTNSDINVLRKTVYEAIRSWYHIDWDLYVMVRAESSGGRHTENSTGLSFGYKFFLIGKRPDGGIVHMKVPMMGCMSLCHKKHQHFQDPREDGWDGRWDPDSRWSGELPQEGLPETGTEARQVGWGGPNSKSLIPATKENVAAVVAFAKAIDALGEEMRRRFAPDAVESTVVAILAGTGVPALTTGEGE
jgi:hypothetical protein